MIDIQKNGMSKRVSQSQFDTYYKHKGWVENSAVTATLKPAKNTVKTPAVEPTVEVDLEEVVNDEQKGE